MLIRLLFYLAAKIEAGVCMAPKRRKPEPSSEAPLDPFRDLISHLHGKAGIFSLWLIRLFRGAEGEVAPVYKAFFPGVTFPIQPAFPRAPFTSLDPGGVFMRGSRAPAEAGCNPPGLKPSCLTGTGL